MEPLFLINGIFPAYWIGQEGFSIEKIQAAFAYVLDAEGWKLYKRNGVSTAVISVDSVAGLATLRQEINLTAQKLPLDLIRKVTAWFKVVYQKNFYLKDLNHEKLISDLLLESNNKKHLVSKKVGFN